jgi:cellulose synthase/poly-beta-1,6-N-acetylglucosamine synthase-like glycosyltransferase
MPFFLLLTFFVVPGVIALIDFVDIVRLKMRRKKNERYPKSEDFAILVPIFGNMSYFKNAEFLKDYSDKVIICTTAHETKQFYTDLNAVCQQYGFRQFRSELSSIKSGKFTRNPWKIFHTLLDGSIKRRVFAEKARGVLLFEEVDGIDNTYCVFLDGDTVCHEDLRKVVGEFHARDLDLSSVRIIPSHTNTLMERMQQFEYQFAMDGRKLYPWMTSGACMVAKAGVLQEVLRHHSHFFQGGDIEIGKLCYSLGYNVGHLDTEFYTDVPETFRKWFKQRVAWSSGDFRHAVINIHFYSWRQPFFFFYCTFVVYAMMPFRIMFLLSNPYVLPFIIVIYWILLLGIQSRYRNKYMLLFPFYSLFQSLVITPLGILCYFYTVYKYHNVGIIRYRYHLEKQGVGPVYS